MAYKAYVVSIVVEPHPDPEVHSIAIGKANGNTVVVSNKTKSGDLGIYFECDGQLSEQFAKDYTRPTKKEQFDKIVEINL